MSTSFFTAAFVSSANEDIETVVSASPPGGLGLDTLIRILSYRGSFMGPGGISESHTEALRNEIRRLRPAFPNDDDGNARVRALLYTCRELYQTQQKAGRDEALAPAPAPSPADDETKPLPARGRH